MENTTENSAVEPVNQCSKLDLNEVTSNKNTNKTASLSKLGDFMNIMSSHVLEANLTKKFVYQIFLKVFSLKFPQHFEVTYNFRKLVLFNYVKSIND